MVVMGLFWLCHLCHPPPTIKELVAPTEFCENKAKEHQSETPKAVESYFIQAAKSGPDRYLVCLSLEMEAVGGDC